MKARLLCAAVLAAGLLGCLGGGTATPAATAPPVSDEDALQFAQRMERFYAALAGVPLDALITYDNKDLRGYFESPGAYADYYSALATAARHETLRDTEARSVRIEEFRFEGPNEAVVDFVVTGKHERGLRFWDVDITRRDVWRRVEGVWLVYPEKL